MGVFINFCFHWTFFELSSKTRYFPWTLGLHQRNFSGVGLRFKENIAFLSITQKWFNLEQNLVNTPKLKYFFCEKRFFKFFVAAKLSKLRLFWVQNTNGCGTPNFWATHFYFSKFVQLLKIFKSCYLCFLISLLVFDFQIFPMSLPSI